MDIEEKLSESEFRDLLQLLNRYINTEMDQWEKWKFKSSFSEIFIDISMKPSDPGSEHVYTDLSHLLKASQSQ